MNTQRDSRNPLLESRTHHMNTQRDATTDPAREVLTLMEAATLLRIGRTTAYELAQ
jgi:hypothetical protein